jgi:hypothetical protein
MSSVTTVDYNIMHRCFAHPSKDVLRHASGNTQNFPSNMSFPSIYPVCQSCAEGKMTRSSYSPSPRHFMASFDKIHMDLEEFSVTIRPRIHRGVIKGTFHFSFHLLLVSLKRFIVHFILYLSSVSHIVSHPNPSHMSVSTMSMLPLYSVHTQVSETCFTYLLFRLYLFQSF